MKILCYSVKLKCLISISDKAYKAIAFDNNAAFIPKSQVFGVDYENSKYENYGMYEITVSESYWISAWILERRELPYTERRKAYFDSITRKMLPLITIKKHIPEKVLPVVSNELEELKR